MEFKIANEDKTEDIEVEETSDHTKSVRSNNEFKKRMRLLTIIIFGGFLILMLVLGVASLFSSKTYSYEEIETILKDSAINYFKDHKKSLPANDTQVVEITDKTLTADEYMKDLSEYTKDDITCSGKVTVQKVDGSYSYTPYLDCGDKYATKSLYSALTKKTVNTGNGLYKNNEGYVFKGENVNNYVQLDKALWRVVKITSDNNFVLILDGEYDKGYSWDNRYNKERKFKSGINDYSASRIRDFLKVVYKDDTDHSILSKSDKLKLVNFDLCTATRSVDNTTKDNSVECSKIINDEKIGLLTVADYINASIDSSCTNTINYSCQNYNYLVTSFDWWLVTGVSGNTDGVFMVNDSGVIEEVYPSNYAHVRPVIHLNNNTFIKSGNGTKEKPYKLK